MSVFEVIGGSDRRSLIKRFERKSKSEAIRELLDFLDCGWRRIDLLEKENADLRLELGGMRATMDEINADANLYRQWFDAVQDTNPGYLEPADYVAAVALYALLGMRVPNSIKEKLPR